eukprot:CAMPEP_0115004448 /NCGR_PEP_ID=MMETSP0216-20121206/19220_1 /TAXON_ID=223996 /ORGANISM="Protocruzia adherens, Strain Boccale" /LENGTH=137 /DNA_ID=CAMNT_0002370461 /DNA_START=85 /DNA_END=495 /DNA_ORIENTATION=-
MSSSRRTLSYDYDNGTDLEKPQLSEESIPTYRERKNTDSLLLGTATKSTLDIPESLYQPHRFSIQLKKNNKFLRAPTMGVRRNRTVQTVKQVYPLTSRDHEGSKKNTIMMDTENDDSALGGSAEHEPVLDSPKTKNF